MAIYKTDRQRRILGDRAVAHRDEFCEIHPAVGEVHGIFSETNARFQHHTDERKREENEDKQAIGRRTTTLQTCAHFYDWGYNQLPALAQPSWEEDAIPEDVAVLRDRLFPLGPPTVIAASSQVATDALSHFLSAIERERRIAYPAEFLNKTQVALQNLQQAVADTVREQGETKASVDQVADSRQEWDEHYNALREVTSGFLRLKKQRDRLDTLFRGLPGGSSKSGKTSENEPENNNPPPDEGQSNG